MKRQNRRRWRSTAFLLVLCFVLGYTVYAELGSDPIEPASVGVIDAPSKSRSPAEPAFTMPPIEEFSETVTRPLFLPSRRPLVPSDEAPQQKASGVEKLFALVGVIISADEHMALLQRRKTGKVLWVVEGQQVDGWRVEAIMPDRMTLRNGEITEEVALKDTVGADRKRRQRRDRRTKRTETPTTTGWCSTRSPISPTSTSSPRRNSWFSTTRPPRFKSATRCRSRPGSR